jgi:hydroxymethylpyrimidine pyrophosphatase-like HAD family hydrolase
MAAGVPVVVATGRSLGSSGHTLTDLGLSTVRLVCSNGAVGYDLHRERMTHRYTFDAGAAARALAVVLPEAAFAVEHELAGLRTTPTLARDYPAQFLDTAPLADLVAQPTTRPIVRADLYPAEVLLRRARATLAGMDVSWHSLRPSWLDFGPAAASKATGVATVADELGIDAVDVLLLHNAIRVDRVSSGFRAPERPTNR